MARGEFGLSRPYDGGDQGKRERIVRGEENSALRCLERVAIEIWDDVAGMGVKAKVMGKGGIANDHLALVSRFAKAGHGVADAFDMIGQKFDQLCAQPAQGGGKGKRAGCDIGQDRVTHVRKPHENHGRFGHRFRVDHRS